MTGIGGLFFRAREPEKLSAWYREHLGVGADFAAGEYVWEQAAGPTVFAPFKADTDDFAADRQWMLNLRVSGLDALLARLRAAGIEITTKAEWDSPETGRFARIHDPEGNPIELWEPPGQPGARQEGYRTRFIPPRTRIHGGPSRAAEGGACLRGAGRRECGFVVG